MHIKNYYSQALSFKAVKKEYMPTVKELDANTLKYNDKKISFVELNSFNTNDMITLNNISKDWDKSMFAKSIYQDAQNINEFEDIDCNVKFYAITTQNKNHEKLIPEKILGLCEIKEEGYKKAFVEFVESNPESINNPYAKYKAIGNGIFQALKNYYDNISLQSTVTALKFYERQGFKPVEKYSRILHWTI